MLKLIIEKIRNLRKYNRIKFYNKNGIKGRVTIKAKTKQDATEKFNKKFGFVNEFSIEKIEDNLVLKNEQNISFKVSVSDETSKVSKIQIWKTLLN